MKITVNVRENAGSMFGGGGENVTVKIEANESVLYGDALERGLTTATAAAATLVQAISGDYHDEAVSDGDEDAVGQTADSEDKADPRHRADGEPDSGPEPTGHPRHRAEQEPEPGDAVRLTWKDGSSRIAIRTDYGYEAPAVPSRAFDDALEITDDIVRLDGIRAVTVAALGETQGEN